MWNARFARSILLSDGRIIRTLDDARAFIDSLPEDDRSQHKWRELSIDLLAVAGDAEFIESRLIDALSTPPFTVVRIKSEIPKKPPAPSVRKRSLQERKRRK